MTTRKSNEQHARELIQKLNGATRGARIVEKRPHVYIAQLSGGGSLGVECVGSIQALLFTCQQLGWKVSHEVSSFSGIPRTRNRLCANMLLDSDADGILMVDRDVSFPPQAAIGLVMSGYDLVGGAYPKLGYDWERIWEVAQKLPREHARELHHFGMVPCVGVEDAALDRPERIEGVGTFVEAKYLAGGFTYITRCALNRMRERLDIEYTTDFWEPYRRERKEWLFYKDMNRDPDLDTPEGRCMSEDWWMTRKAVEAGLRPMLYCDAILGHTGRVTFTSNVMTLLQLRAQKKAAEAAEADSAAG